MTNLFIDDYRVKKIICVHEEQPKNHSWFPPPPWEMFYMDAACSKNEALILHLDKAYKKKSELTLKLVIEDYTYAFYTTVEYLLFEVEDKDKHKHFFTLALHLSQEICRNDSDEICFRSITAPGHTAP